MKQRLRRPLALLLTVVMLLGLLPTAALAAGNGTSFNELTLTKEDGDTVDLQTNNETIRWNILETWTLDVDADLVTGQQSTMTITLAQGMQFVGLDVDSLSNRTGIESATWTPGITDWGEGAYAGYTPQYGTLTIQFDSGAASLEGFQLSLRPDVAFFPPELSGENSGLSIPNAITVALDDNSPIIAGVTAIHMGEGRGPSFGDQHKKEISVPSGEASSVELGGYIYSGWPTLNGQFLYHLTEELTATFSVPKGLTLSSSDSSVTVTKTEESDENGTLWTVTVRHLYASAKHIALTCQVPNTANADTIYLIRLKGVSSKTEGQKEPWVSSTSATTWTIYVKDPGVVEIKTELLPATNVYNFTKKGNLSENFSDYNTVFAAVRMSNTGPVAIEKSLIYEAEFGQEVQFVTAVGIPCDWDYQHNDGLPTSITITWDDKSITTITGVDKIREVASQFCYPGCGFMLLAKDLVGLKNYGANKSIQAVKVELPELPKDYVSAGPSPIQEGQSAQNTFTAAWGRVREDVSDGATSTNKYRLYEKAESEPEGESDAEWTEVTTTVKDSGVISGGDYSSMRATITVEGKDGTTAAGGDIVHVKQSIVSQRYHNGPSRPAETIIVDPVVYLFQPEGLTLYAQQAQFTLNTGEQIKSSVQDITNSTNNLPDGWKLYEYTFTDSDGNPIVLGWYDGDWCNTSDGTIMTAAFDYKVDEGATAVSYDMQDYIRIKSSLNMPFVRSGDTDTYQLNGGNAIGRVGSSTFTVQPEPKFLIEADIQIQGEGEENWYTYDPNNPDATTALFGEGDTANVRITVSNLTGQTVNGVSIYVPVPKKGSTILGDYFGGTPGFDMYVSRNPDFSGDGNGQWEVYYGNVTGVTTEGSENVPTGQFTFADSGSWSTNFNNSTNLIYLNLTGTMQEGDVAVITLHLSATTENAQTGQMNLFKPWYQFNAAGVTMSDTSKICIFGAELQNGVVSGIVFADKDRDGVQDADELGISGVEVSAVDTTGRSYGTEITDERGKYSFTSVPSDAVLTVTVKNPKDPGPNHEGGSYRFSPVGTGTEGVVSNVIAATDNKSASKSDVSLSGGTATVNAGLITPYTVRFVVTGGNADPDSVKIYGGQKLSDVLDKNVDVTTGEGATFQEKWTKNPVNDGESNEVEHNSLLNETVSADTTYTAQLEAKSYIIEAKYGNEIYRETVTHGGEISDQFPSDETAQAAAPEGNVFTGWRLSTEEKLLQRNEIVGAEVTATATYIAQYAPKSGITVKLDANGGKFDEDETTLELNLTYGDAVAKAEGYKKPTYAGHTFLGWAESKDAGSEDVITNLTCPVEDTTYYAVWREKTYTITFQGYAQGSGTKTVLVKASEAIGAGVIPKAEKDDATFLGWSDGEKTYSTEELAKVVPTANTTYTAHFTDVYSVTFYAGAHGMIDGNTSATRSVANGETLRDIPTVDASEGWYFVWWADANGTRMHTSEALKTLPITDPMNFYAKYGQISGNTNITLKTPVDNSTNSTALTASLDDEKAEASYRWQKFNGSDWADVTNGTSASLSLTGLEITDNGAKYQCVVTSGGNSATIGPVALNVKKDNQDEPNVSRTDPSTIGGTGSIGVTAPKLTTAMEVSTDGTQYAPVTDEQASSGITGISEGTTYYIRYAATDYLNASPAQTIRIGSFNPNKEPTPNGSFEASTMTLSKVENGQKYRIGGEGEWTEIIGTTVDLSDAGLKAGDTIQIYKPGNRSTTMDSDTQTIHLTQAAKPAGMATDETSYESKDGSITITDYNSSYTYQISSDNGSTWTDAIVSSNGVISNLAPGSYVIRVKGSGTTLASEPSDTLTVNAYVRSSEAEITLFKVTVHGKDYTGTIDQEAGTITVTLPAGTESSVLDSLTPTITYTGESISPDNVAQNFSQNDVEYTVTAENGTTKSYKATITIAQPDTYTITVANMEHGAITTTPSGSMTAGIEVTLTITPDKGYRLKENSLKVTYQDDEQTVVVTDNKFTMPAHNVTVSAEFEAIQYTITYVLNDGINDADNPTNYTVENAITLSKPTREDYIFQGWTWRDQTTPQQSVNISAGSVTGDLTFTAHWQANTPTPPTKYTVTVKDSHAGDNSGAGSYDEGATVTIYAGEYEGYTFVGWTVTSGNVILASNSSATTTFTMPAANVTVTANWTKDEEPEPTPSDVITVTPADIIIYMGGDKGYEGVVNGNGQIVGSNSLPEPGFVFELPGELDGVDVEDIVFKNADGSKTWKVELYEGLDAGAERKLYTIVPTYTDPDPIRVVFSDDDTTIVSDNFTVGLELNRTFGMKLYTEPAGEIFATYGSETYSVVTGSGELTVRGTTSEVEIVTVDTQAPDRGVGVVAEAGTTYTINGSEVQVGADAQVSLLFDEIINNQGNDRTQQLETAALSKLGQPADGYQYAYEFKYLDLVDASNGNAWVAASKDVTIYWPLPANANPGSLKVLHFAGLHRSNENGGTPNVNDANVTQVENVRIENGYVVFEVGSAGFSPFALVWEEEIPENTFIITASAGSGGSISPSGSVQVTAGGSQTFYITSDRGYHIADILVNGTSVGAVSSYTFPDVQKNQTITAIFARDENWGGDTGNDGNDDDDDSYTLYYHSNFGRDKTFYQTDDQRIMVVRDYEDMSRLPDREDYVFLGWNTRADGSGEDYAPGDKFRVKGSADHLYAMWEQTMPDLLDTGVSRWLNTEDHGAYLSGYGGGLFGADNSMTRAEVAQMFYALLKDKNVPITKTFYDVPADAWYATAVNTLASLGMVSGGTDGNYRPNDPITRAEFCVIALAFAYEPENARCNFTDVTLSDWFYPYVAQAASYGWIGGYTDGSFGPNDSITRAQVTTIVNNMLGRSADVDYVNRHTEELNRFTDVPSTHWAYYQIMEATNAHDYDHVKGQENWTRLHR